MTLEVHVENHFVKRVEALGGITAKMTIKGRVGWPDRLAILPGGRVMLVELKRPGGRLRPTQVSMVSMLRALGVEVHVLSSKEEVDRLFDES